MWRTGWKKGGQPASFLACRVILAPPPSLLFISLLSFRFLTLSWGHVLDLARMDAEAAERGSSWLAGLWQSMYLEARAPTMIHISPQVSHPRFEFAIWIRACVRTQGGVCKGEVVRWGYCLICGAFFFVVAGATESLPNNFFEVWCPCVRT